jgi:hypothetical protein
VPEARRDIGAAIGRRKHDEPARDRDAVSRQDAAHQQAAHAVRDEVEPRDLRGDVCDVRGERVHERVDPVFPARIIPVVDLVSLLFQRARHPDHRPARSRQAVHEHDGPA